MSFRTRVGIIRGWALGGREVRVQLTEPSDYRAQVALDLPGGERTAAHLNTGVPHAVLTVDDADAIDVALLGRAVRFHRAFAPQGANANFVQIVDANEAIIRTYERGVEGETLACGTGCAATAATLALAGRMTEPIRLRTRGGEVLTVNFSLEGQLVKNLTLQGPVRYVAEGVIVPEAWA
jgi:diaminopimelate epimerase